jgi:predicted secreted protein
MSTLTLIAVYFLIWWVVFFAMLPLGVKSQREAQMEFEPGTDPGAPHRPLLWWKIAATSVVAAVLLAIFYALSNAGWLSLDRLPMPFALPSG